MDRVCRGPGCETAVHGRSVFCSDRCRKARARLADGLVEDSKALVAVFPNGILAPVAPATPPPPDLGRLSKLEATVGILVDEVTLLRKQVALLESNHVRASYPKPSHVVSHREAEADESDRREFEDSVVNDLKAEPFEEAP